MSVIHVYDHDGILKAKFRQINLENKLYTPGLPHRIYSSLIYFLHEKGNSSL